MIRFLQLNLNHCEAAKALAMQMVREMRIDVAILYDQHRTLVSPYTWISDANHQVAIWVCGGLPMQRCTSEESRYYT